MINFSILMCSRDRIDILEQNITLIKHLANEPDAIQVLIGADDDDAPTVALVKNLQDRYINIELVVRPRLKNLHQFNNILASQAAGKYLWVLNDDALLEISDWDSIIQKQIEEQIKPHPDRIGYFVVSSNSTDQLGEYAEFPLVTREAYQALSFVETEETTSWGCDAIMHKIYSSVDRVFKIQTDRPIRHVFHENGSAPNSLRDNMIGVFKEQFGQDWNGAVIKMQSFVKNCDVTPYRQRLLEKINGKN